MCFGSQTHAFFRPIYNRNENTFSVTLSKSHVSLISIESRLRAERTEFDLPSGSGDFSSSPPSTDKLWGRMGVEGGGESLSGLKWPGRESHHSLSFNAEFRNARSYTSTTPYAFMA
jgi:hypothetical protein